MANKPTGLKIKRDGNKFNASWSNKSTKGKKVSKVEWKRCINNAKTKKGKLKWEKAHTLGAKSKKDEFYTYKGGTLTSVRIAIRTYTNGWSDWVKSKEYAVKKPNVPTTSIEEGTYPSSTFKWSVDGAGKSDDTFFQNAYYRTALQENAGSDPNKNTKWSAWSDPQKDSGSKTIVEELNNIAGKKMTRWYQVYAKGPAGNVYGTVRSMRYALPNEPVIFPDNQTKSPMAKPDKSYFYVYFKYKIERTPNTPIESIMPQYLIGTPGNEFLDPPGSGWTDTVTTLPPSGAGNINAAASFNTTSTVGNNQCLWVRVVTKNSGKQNQQTPSDPYLVYKGILSKPDDVEVGAIDETTFRSVVKAKNNTGVPGSFITIFLVVDGKESCVGVIPNGKDQTVIQFTKVEENPAIRLYTMAGMYEVSSSFKKTEDTQVDTTKLYFRLLESNDANDYEQIKTEGTENPKDEWWFDRTGSAGNYVYQYTNDTTVTTGKDYFKRTKGKYVLADVTSGSNPTLSHWYEIDGESSYNVDPQWKSDPVEASTLIKVPQNISASLADSNFSGNVRVNWDWPWKTANVAELSWSKNPDAWESTQEPSKYEITNSKPASWVISDMEAGTNWYIRVRLGVTTDTGTNYGPYGNATPWPLPLTSYPATPLISASKKVITVDGETTISWVYSSADGTPQRSAVLYEVLEDNGQKVYNKIKDIGSEQYVNLKADDESLAWSSGEEHTLVVTVESEAGESSQSYSNEITITVAEPARCKIENLSIVDGVLREMPITFDVIEGYSLTSDTSVQQGKDYYNRIDIADHTYTSVGEIENPRYQEVSSPEGSPSEQGWYELVNDEYVATQDTEVVEGKTYFVKIEENPKDNGWYELDETVEPNVYVLTADTSMVSEKEYYVQSLPPSYIYELELNPSGNPKENGYFDRIPLDSETVSSVVIKRAEDFKQDRPDETEYDGFAGETIYAGVPENGSVTINTNDTNLIGYLDDRADYILELNVQDKLGQPAKDKKRFTVNWSHQAFAPEARVEIDQENAVAFLYPIAPRSAVEYVLTQDTEIDETKKYYTMNSVSEPVVEDISTYLELSGSVYVYTTDTEIDQSKTYYIPIEVENPVVSDIGNYYEYKTIDVCDIYRLSVDKPELIYQDATFGETYVDPYPTIGEFGGHRFVCKTPNGDYITGTEDNSEIAWVDTGEEDGDRFDTHSNIIDFDGQRVFLLYEVDISNSWSKDFQETRYLGGSIQGDWNPGVSKTGSINVTTVSDYDQDTIRLMHRLADYPGICHVRSKDGASYSADVQVNETYEYTRAPRFNKYDLSITRVDPETLDGLTLDEWRESQGASE